MLDEASCDSIIEDLGKGIIHSSRTAMQRNYILPFLVSIIVLVLSEYFFLDELFGGHRIVILLLTAAGTILSIISIVSLIRKYY